MIVESIINKLQAIIGTDAGNRGMKPLIVPGDLYQASKILGTVKSVAKIVVLSGFPCMVNHTPPTETDGPPGTLAIARAAAALGHDVVVATDACNEQVFKAAMQNLALPPHVKTPPALQVFPSQLSDTDEARFQQLARDCQLLISCERAGPSKDGVCYTMRGIDMNVKGLIAPLHRLVSEKAREAPFLAVGDGGNELGMGKVVDKIVNNPKISNGDQIACVIAADHLIAASVSNWGGYALAAGAALCRAEQLQEEVAAKENNDATTLLAARVQEWVDKCLPSEEDEVKLLQRAVAAGCRDGVSGEMEATVDGMPLETSLQCLRDIRAAALQSAP